MKKRILIVDDDKNIRDLLQEFLREEGYLTTTAVDGEDALEKLDYQNYDLYILDICMPRMDGLHLMKEIKHKYPFAVIVMTTGFSTLENAVKAIREGAFHYIAKPIMADEFIDVVRRGLAYAESLGTTDKLEPNSITEMEKNLPQMLKGFSQEDVAQFEEISIIRTYQPGDMVPLDDKNGSIILVEAGELAVILGTVKVESIYAGQCWGEESFLNISYLFTGLRAVLETRVRHFRRQQIMEFFRFRDERALKRYTINLMHIFYQRWKSAFGKLGLFVGYEESSSEGRDDPKI
jgi:CheY-like chemotaxis protein